MAINIKVTKGKKDSNANLIKKFTGKVKESGVIPRVKSLRYAERNASPFVKKTQRLKSIKKRAEIEEQIKLGKRAPRMSRGRR